MPVAVPLAIQLLRGPSYCKYWRVCVPYYCNSRQYYNNSCQVTANIPHPENRPWLNQWPGLALALTFIV